MTTWSEIDEPVLRWLHGRDSSLLARGWIVELGLRREDEPFDEIPGATTEHVDQALTRLHGHRLIAGERGETVGYAYWSRLRVTGLGLQALGEWPDLDQLASAAGLKLLLTELANAAPDEDDQGAIRRLIGVAGEVGEGVVLSTLNSAAGDVGAGLGGD